MEQGTKNEKHRQMMEDKAQHLLEYLRGIDGTPQTEFIQSMLDDIARHLEYYRVGCK